MPLLALSTMSLPSMQTITKEDEVGIGVDWIENFQPVWQRTIRSESTQDKAGSLSPTSLDYVMLFAIFSKKPKLFFLHQLNSKNNSLVLLFQTILALMLFPVVCRNGLQGLKMDWSLGQQLDTEHIQQFQPDKYVTDSDYEKEGDFGVVYGRTCMTSWERSVRDHHWCVWIYKAGVIWWLHDLDL